VGEIAAKIDRGSVENFLEAGTELIFDLALGKRWWGKQKQKRQEETSLGWHISLDA